MSFVCRVCSVRSDFTSSTVECECPSNRKFRHFECSSDEGRSTGDGRSSDDGRCDECDATYGLVEIMVVPVRFRDDFNEYVRAVAFFTVMYTATFFFALATLYDEPRPFVDWCVRLSIFNCAWLLYLSAYAEIPS